MTGPRLPISGSAKGLSSVRCGAVRWNLVPQLLLIRGSMTYRGRR
jgi:hypothetical protein